MTVLKRFGGHVSGWFFGVLSIVSLVASAVITRTGADPKLLALVLNWTAGVSTAAVVAVFLVAQFNAWSSERDKYEAELAKNVKPDIRGHLSSVCVSTTIGHKNYRRNRSFVEFEIALCNHSPADTNISKLQMFVADSCGHRYTVEAFASRTETVTEYSSGFAGVGLYGSTGNSTHRKDVKIIEVVLQKGITQRFKGSATFDPPLPEEIRVDSLKAIASDYAGSYDISPVGEIEVSYSRAT
jgi:hypothetical protein